MAPFQPLFLAGKALEKAHAKVPGALEEWRDARSDEYFSRGESKNEYGNRHFRLTHIKAYAFQLEVRVPDEKNDAKWLPLIGMCFWKTLNLLTAAAFCGSMITVRLMRRSPDHYQAFITVDEVVGGKVLWDLSQAKMKSLVASTWILTMRQLPWWIGRGNFVTRKSSHTLIRWNAKRQNRVDDR